MADLHDSMMALLHDVLLFAERGNFLQLRQYQVEVAQAVVDSVVNQRGLTFVVIFPRQSGKNELQAQLESYLLAIYSSLEAEMVKVSPTWKPQSLNAMRRLERVLKRSLVVQKKWTKEQGYIYRIESARIFFLSGSPTTNIVGATANILLECDEAQDVLISKWDKDIAPMAASTNATRIFWGTAWTSRTLLAREKRAAEEARRAAGSSALWDKLTQPVMQNNSGKFLRESSEDDIRIFESVAGHVLDRLGYERVHVPQGQERQFSDPEINAFDRENERMKQDLMAGVDKDDLERRGLQEALLKEIQARSAV